MFSLTDVKMMAQECANQHSGEMSVSHLANAIYFASQLMYGNPVTVHCIEMLGTLVEPVVNCKGFRTMPVFIDGKVAGVHSDNIHNALDALCEAYNENRISRDELYQEFESIHPFADGNGRVGFVLYNLANLNSSNNLQATPHYVKS